MLGRANVSLMVLETLVVEVEAVLNDRPLTYRRREKLRMGKVSRMALYSVYRRKSFAMLIVLTSYCTNASL